MPPKPYINRTPIRIRIPHGGDITGGDLEARFGVAGMPVHSLSLQAAHYLPVTILEWSAVHEDGTAMGGWLEITYEYTDDHVQLLVEMQVLEPEGPAPGHRHTHLRLSFPRALAKAERADLPRITWAKLGCSGLLAVDALVDAGENILYGASAHARVQ